MEKVSLKISISPRDFRFIKYLLPHQLKVWNAQVDEILIVFDHHGYDSEAYTHLILQINSLIDELKLQYEKLRLLLVDYSEKAKKEISSAYFNNKKVPEKTHRYGPYYAYFYGFYHARHEYVFNLDSDMFFGGHNPNWIREAVELLKQDQEVVTCSPLPGPPTASGKLTTQAGQIDNSRLRKVYFDSFSTRIFLIHKASFVQHFCPLPIKFTGGISLLRAILRGKPIYALPEDVLSDIMRARHLKRVDFLGTGEGIWSLHPPFRNESFFEKLPELVSRIENNDIPEEQRGDYDINDSMVNWDDAWEELRNASLKRRMLRLIGIK